MATSSYAKSFFGSLPADIKTAMHKFSEYVFDRSLEFGPVDPNETTSAATNFRGRWVKAVTSTSANTEFSVAHGLGKAPNVFWPIGNPRSVNSVVPTLTVSRAADMSRLYLTSPTTGAVVFLYVE
jgi:hypothetical protein